MRFCRTARRVLALVATFGVGVPAQAGSDPGHALDVRVTLSRAAPTEWVAEYRFSRAAPAWVFPRSFLNLENRPWRPLSWTVETSGVTLDRIGKYDVLNGGGKPLRRVKIRIRPYAAPLQGDYTPALRFSDGGIAFYSEHFAVSPLAAATDAARLPADLNGYHGLKEVAGRFEVQDPGHRLLAAGRMTRNAMDAALGEDGIYVYSGSAPILETPAFAGVIDQGLPLWIRVQLDDFTPRLMQLYADRLGAPAGARPMAFVSWGGADFAGSSLNGSVLPGTVVMSLHGAQLVDPSPVALDRVRWFLGHESAHFWMGQTVRYSRRGESWITEGSADLLAIRAIAVLTPEYDTHKALQEELDICLKSIAPNQPLAAAAEAGIGKPHYACGAILLLAAEAAARRRDPKTDLFGYVRGMIDANRGDGIVDENDWLKALAAVAGQATADQARDFVDRGANSPPAFFAGLFTATGVRFTQANERLILLE